MQNKRRRLNARIIIIICWRQKETFHSHLTRHIFLNNRLILFTEFTILHSDIISKQKCKLVTFHADTRKVIGRSKLLHPYAMPVQVMDYSTKHRCIQSALRPPRQINRRCCEIAVRSLQCNMFNSETFLGVVNVNVANCIGNSHYFVGKSGCSEKLKAS